MVVKASQALEDDSLMMELHHADSELLQSTYKRSFVALESAQFEECRLHGEPHNGNRIMTRDGIRWIDLESCCIGPLEWDLAFQPDEVVHLFPDTDLSLLALLRRLNSARVATWCLGSRYPEMHEHGEIHLSLLRQPSDDSGRLPEIP